MSARSGNDRQMHPGGEDVEVLQSFSYKQELKRTIRLFGSFAIAFSAISITTGIFTNYSFVLSTAGPVGIWSWPVTVIGQVIVALVFAELAGKMPLAGYSYQWVSRLIGPGLGWMAGWMTFAFLVLVVPAVDGGLAPVLAGLLKIDPTKINLMWIVIATLLVQATLNIIGVKLASQINSGAVFTEAIGVVGLTLVLGGIALFKTHPSASILFNHSVVQGPWAPAFMLTMLMGLFTLVGFEAPANLAEETVEARKTLPRAVMLSIAISGILGTLFLIAATLGIKDLGAVTASASPLPMIIEQNLGSVVGTSFLVLVAISIFACGLILTTSASRLVFAMSRDNVFVFSNTFRRVDDKHAVPVAAVLLVLALGIVAAIFADSLTLLVGATAVLPALIYLVTVGAYRFTTTDVARMHSGFSLGSWSHLVANAAIVWLVASILILTVPAQFHEVAIVTAAILVVGAGIYLLQVRPKIMNGSAGIRPEQSQSTAAD